jgi:hypothetical protein
MTTSTNDTMDYTGTENLLRLLKIEMNLSPYLRDAINEKATKFLVDLTEHVGYFLGSGDLDDENQSEDEIRTLVQCVPTSLSYEDEDGDLPIQCAVYHSGGVPFIPMLIEEGMKHNVGGEEMRGGLLYKSLIVSQSVLGMLSLISYGTDYNSDVRYLNVIKRLREMGFIEKEDIKEYNLLWDSCEEGCSKRFNYFADWDPSALKFHWDEESLLHSRPFVSPRRSASWCIIRFQLALSATLRHYPHELGLLLLKNDIGDTPSQMARKILERRTIWKIGDTPFQVARKFFGEQESWKMIKKCLDESNGGSKILERDPETKMYSFLLAAAGDTSELDLVYYLVRRNPLALFSEQCTDNDNDNAKTSSTDILCSQKRKR